MLHTNPKTLEAQYVASTVGKLGKISNPKI